MDFPLYPIDRFAICMVPFVFVSIAWVNWFLVRLVLRMAIYVVPLAFPAAVLLPPIPRILTTFASWVPVAHTSWIAFGFLVSTVNHIALREQRHGGALKDIGVYVQDHQAPEPHLLDPTRAAMFNVQESFDIVAGDWD
ncbi:uncharacterized protein EHS24_002303 [Apiotrichum porosum]|uniref:Uncharacterized protein n=1 Tax=Apiotrichum porosum TaxID=105984 RepID=A0A427XI71_9TREE|nr:uncharacterized protein EHS24_002303 [Apiotrichum porosum]RSH78575.1 hypothetical protein EHS24_002303 [Apiotrichum porosum]